MDENMLVNVQLTIKEINTIMQLLSENEAFAEMNRGMAVKGLLDRISVSAIRGVQQREQIVRQQVRQNPQYAPPQLRNQGGSRLQRTTVPQQYQQQYQQQQMPLPPQPPFRNRQPEPQLMVEQPEYADPVAQQQPMTDQIPYEEEVGENLQDEEVNISPAEDMGNDFQVPETEERDLPREVRKQQADELSEEEPPLQPEMSVKQPVQFRSRKDVATVGKALPRKSVRYAPVPEQKPAEPYPEFKAEDF